MPGPDRSTVEAYVAKHRLAEELSSALNEAIRAQSEDPFAVLAEHFRALSTAAKDGDENDEAEDDDTILEEEATQQQAAQVGRAKRKVVMASAVEIPEGWTPPSVPKEKEQLDFLMGVVKDNKLMKLLSPSDQSLLVEAFSPEQWAEGTTIITQGDAGDKFYIVESGTADVSISGVGKVSTASRGTAFGELALLHDAPRAATIVATSPLSGYSIDALTFKCLLMGKSQQDTREGVEFLSAIKLLSPLDEAQKRELAATATERRFDDGANIICEGDEGHDFYIIKQGEVKCTKVGRGEVSRRLTTGDFFGELALLKSDKREATVSATKDNTICLCISRPAFKRMLGPLSKNMTEMASGDRQ